VVLAIVVLPGCTTPPVDPDNTLERVRGGTMRVGITEHPPWTDLSSGSPAGIEVEVLERFAVEVDAEIDWFDGSEEELFGALKQGQLDVVIGGLGAKNPYSKEASLTHPYLTTQVVVAGPAENLPEDIDGVDVAVEAGTEEAGVLAKTDADVHLVDDVTTVEGLRAIDNWLLDDLDLVDTGDTLVETDHVMAVRLGENGWLVALERFLLENEEAILMILDEAGTG
jgi:polar amino acid transport system substrate-binding protein